MTYEEVCNCQITSFVFKECDIHTSHPSSHLLIPLFFCFSLSLLHQHPQHQYHQFHQFHQFHQEIIKKSSRNHQDSLKDTIRSLRNSKMAAADVAAIGSMTSTNFGGDNSNDDPNDSNNRQQPLIGEHEAQKWSNSKFSISSFWTFSNLNYSERHQVPHYQGVPN